MGYFNSLILADVLSFAHVKLYPGKPRMNIWDLN